MIPVLFIFSHLEEVPIYMTTKFKTEIASINDIPTLVHHNRLMFKEVWTYRNLKLNEDELSKMDDAYRKKLQQEIESCICKVWVVKEKEKVVASGAVSIASLNPFPGDSSCTVAYLHSVYTEVEYRNKGLAKVIIKDVIDYCKSNNINRVLLNASEVGRPIYEKFGFTASNNTMRINLND